MPSYCCWQREDSLEVLLGVRAANSLSHKRLFIFVRRLWLLYAWWLVPASDYKSIVIFVTLPLLLFLMAVVVVLAWTLKPELHNKILLVRFIIRIPLLLFLEDKWINQLFVQYWVTFITILSGFIIWFIALTLLFLLLLRQLVNLMPMLDFALKIH